MERPSWTSKFADPTCGPDLTVAGKWSRFTALRASGLDLLRRKAAREAEAARLQAEAARQAAEEAEQAAREAALEAERKAARDARYAARKARR